MGRFRCQYAEAAPQYVKAVLEWWEEAHVRGLHDAIERQVGWVTQTRGDQQRQQKPAVAGGQHITPCRWTGEVDDGKVEKMGADGNTVQEYGSTNGMGSRESAPLPSVPANGAQNGKHG